MNLPVRIACVCNRIFPQSHAPLLRGSNWAFRAGLFELGEGGEGTLSPLGIRWDGVGWGGKGWEGMGWDGVG